MTSRVTVGRRTGDTTDNADGMEVDEWAPVHSGLPFRLSAGSAGAGYRTVRVGDAEIQVAVRIGHLPATTDNIHDGDLLLLTEGENEGLVLQVAEATGYDQGTALRLPVFEVSLPEGWTT
jgi:hypothetical protein